MSQEYKKTLPMIIACFYIAVSIVAPLGYLVTYFKHSHDLESEESYQSSHIHLVLYAAGCVLLWTIPSILLIKGIRENRPKLMAPWLYLNYLSLVVTIVVMIVVIFFMSSWAGSVKAGFLQCVPYAISWVLTFLFIIPVRKLYIQFRQPAALKPAPVEPACAAVAKKPEDDKRYMPIFENC